LCTSGAAAAVDEETTATVGNGSGASVLFVSAEMGVETKRGSRLGGRGLSASDAAANEAKSRCC